MEAMRTENEGQEAVGRDISEGIKSRFYLIGPTFPLAIFFWVHYQMGLPKLLGSLSFPDLVCLFGCVFLIVYFLFSYFGEVSQSYNLMAFGGLACGVVSMLCIALPNVFGLPYSIPIIIGAFLYAFHFISYCLLWLHLYGRQNIMAITYLLFSVAVGYMTAWLILGLDSVRSVVALVGVTILAALFLLYGLRKNPEASKSEIKKEDFDHLPKGFILTSFAFSVSYMYAIMVNGLQSFHSIFTWDLPIASLMLLTLGLLLRKQLTLIRLFSLAAPLMIIGLLLTLFIDVNSAFLFNLFHLGFFIYLIFVLVLYCGCVQQRKVNAFRLACLLILSIFIGCFAGRLLYPVLNLLFSDFTQQTQSVVSIVIIGLLVVCAIYGSQSIYRLFGSKAVSLNLATLNVADEQGLNADQIILQYGLSEREGEVLELLLEEKSATQVAEEMVVAHGTVKAHIRNIYKKLGIHQRNELFALSVKGKSSQ